MGSIEKVQGGGALALETRLVEGRFTLVEFAAEWCQTCRAVEHVLDAAARRHPNLLLLRVDVRSWTSEVVEEHRVRSLPDLRLYRGKDLVSRDDEVIWSFLGVRFDESS